ncbi:alpha/beta hydrolase [Sphaerisporangium rufum]|nr:alpha/beta hydrolase [Sphaerisporangium rufum]
MRTRVLDDPRFGPETDALLAGFGSDDGEPMTYEKLRAARAGRADPALAGRPEPVAVRADLLLPRGAAPPVPVRVYRDGPPRPLPLLLWLHGGGFVGGTLDDIDAACAALARRGGCVVVSLDYRLAPEHPFPAALDDTFDALCRLAGDGGALGGDGRIAIGGQSAGGNLAAAACLLARERGGPRVAAQVLCYPWLDFRAGTESWRLFEGVFLSSRTAEWYRDQYLAGRAAGPHAAPLRAADLRNLPPALVLGAGRDPLRDDAREYARRLREAGVAVEYVEYADTMHAFLNFPGALSAARRALDDIGRHLARTFTGAGGPARDGGTPPALT